MATIPYQVTALIPQHLRMQGRSAPEGEGMTCDFSATGAIFAVTSPNGCTVQAELHTAGDVYFHIFVDGVRQGERVYLPGAEGAQITAPIRLSAGDHVVRLVRASNLWHARTELIAIHTDGTFLPVPPKRARHIEFIGDSLTCGYGVTPDATEVPKAEAGGAKYCDATHAYPFLVAEALGAEITVCGYSGWGLTCGASVTDEATGKLKMVRTIPTAYPCTNHLRAETLWVPQEIPDLVVINLGSNDHSFREKTETDEKTMQATAVAFMRQVRKMYGKDVPIIQAYGMIKEGFADAIRAAVDEMGGADNGVYYVAMPYNRDGGNGHPSAAGQQAAADTLLAFIRQEGL